MIRSEEDRYHHLWVENKATRIRAERRSDYWMSQMQVDPSKSVLEIGCGDGMKAHVLALKTKMNILATDIDPEYIEVARKNYELPNLKFGVLDSTKLAQFKQGPFDYIVGNGVLHHLYHTIDETFTNLLSLLKPNGKIIFVEPNIQNPFVYFTFTYPVLRKKIHLDPDEMAFSKKFATKKLLQAGYKDIQVEYKDFLLPGIPDFLIKPSIATGNVLEKTPLLKTFAQSIFISAVKR